MKTSPLQEHTSPLSAQQADQLNRLIETLSSTQATWISGYLTGINASLSEGAVAVAPQAAPAAAAQPGAALTILYGSQTGNAEGIGERLKAAAEAKGFAAKLVDMDDYKPNQLKKEQNLVVLVSTHGEGEPPDNAIELHEYLHGKKAPKLDGLKFAVLALGDTSYEFYCQTGKDFDTQLEKLGGERIAERVDCDVDYEDAADAFVEKMVDTFGQNLAGNASQGAHPTVTSMPGLAPASGDTITRKNPYTAEVLTNIVLNGRGSEKEVRHIELSTEDSGLIWQPGDSLGVRPENSPAVVAELISSLDMHADEKVTGVDGEVSLHDALSRDYEITTLTRPFVEKYAQLAESEKLDALLGDGQRSEFAEYLDGRHVIDLVEDYPVKGLAGGDFVRLLRKLPPRLYSIASSHAANPDEVHLTVATVRYESHGRAREGVASAQLADRIGEDGQLPIYVDRNKNFKLPESGDTPIIMIGPGTGVAPFRAFLQEREEHDAGGKNWLFFGAQHFRTDFLYQSEWLKWREQGLLSRIDVAFSRDQRQKIYVQDKLLEQAKEIYAWLQEGANIYVCGDADAMAHDVHEALIKIAQNEGGMQAEGAADYVKRLQKDKRYQRDVY